MRALTYQLGASDVLFLITSAVHMLPPFTVCNHSLISSTRPGGQFARKAVRHERRTSGGVAGKTFRDADDTRVRWWEGASDTAMSRAG